MPLRLVPPIHRATHRVGLYLADLRDDGLSQGEAHILALLATAAPATIAELHRGLAHKRSTLTSILDRLAERGFVTFAICFALLAQVWYDQNIFFRRYGLQAVGTRLVPSHLLSLPPSLVDI